MTTDEITWLPQHLREVIKRNKEWLKNRPLPIPEGMTVEEYLKKRNEEWERKSNYATAEEWEALDEAIAEGRRERKSKVILAEPGLPSNLRFQAVFDTNVVSGLHRVRKDQNIWTPYHIIRDEVLEPCIAAETYQELLYGALKGHWGEFRKTALLEELDRYVLLPADKEVASTCANVREETRALGRLLDFSDAWIAATAIVHGIPLVTHDLDLIDLNLYGLDIITRLPPI